jgi:hypothetical protein
MARTDAAASTTRPVPIMSVGLPPGKKKRCQPCLRMSAPLCQGDIVIARALVLFVSVSSATASPPSHSAMMK